MKYTTTVKGASVRQAVRILLTDEFAVAFAGQIPVELVEATVTQSEENVWHHVMSCRFETRQFDLPSMIRKVLPDTVHLTWAQTWTINSESEATAELRVRTQGKPSLKTKGHVLMHSQEDILNYRYKGETQVDVPLVGGKLADMVDSKLVSGILSDQVEVLARMVDSR